MKLCEIALTPPIVAIIISFGLMFDAFAADRYVSAEKDYGSGPNGEVKDGDLLYDTIQGAIDKANAGDTVWVKDGFVCEGGSAAGSASGFSCQIKISKAITLRSQSGEGRSGNPPIIRGAWANPDATCLKEAVGSGQRRPLYVGAAATVIGFVLERGAAHTLDSDYSSYGGGGITGKQGTIEKCVIRNCYSGYGGGVHSPASSDERLTLVDCVISNNFAQYRGDGAWGALTLKNCLVAGNGGDPNNSTKNGGGVSGKSDTFRIWVEGCVISNNTTVGSGGGATWAKISKGSRIVGNTASASGGGATDSALVDSEICLNKVTGTHTSASAGGGLISCVATNCVISGNVAQIGGGVSGGTTVNCYLANNKSRGHGGGVCLTSTANLCVGCTVVSNTAVQWGGGLYVTADKASFYNCLVAWNEQSADSGIGASGVCGEWTNAASTRKYARLVNCTVVSNRLSSGTNARAGTSQCELVNTVVWGNLNANGKASNTDATRSAVNSCAPELSDTTKYPGCTAANPKFRRGCVYQIGPRSPCRETGAILTDDAVFSSMQKDIDGNPRFGEKDGEPTIDMGCCQYAPFGLMLKVK